MNKTKPEGKHVHKIAEDEDGRIMNDNGWWVCECGAITFPNCPWIEPDEPHTITEDIEYATRYMTFKNHDELIKTIASMPEDMVCLIGYVDERGDIQPIHYHDVVRRALSRKDEEWKEKVRGLRMEKLIEDYDDPEIPSNTEIFDNGYNQAVDELNKRIDDLLK